MLQRRPITQLLVDAAKQFPDAKMFGAFQFGKKILAINDLETAKHVLIKDFDHFVDRGLFSFTEFADSKSEEGKAINLWLLSLEGDQWKQMRNIVSPVFTSGKLKLMSGDIDKVGVQLEEFLTTAEKNGDALEASELFGKLTLDAIATSGF